MPDGQSTKRGRGRPLKFGSPARSLTLTLPDDVVTELQARDRDIARAIVHLLKSAMSRRSPSPAVALHKTGRRAVIVVKPVAALRRIEGVELISLGDPHRALIAFSGGMTTPQFELRIQDLLDGSGLSHADREVIGEVSRVLREARRSARCRVSGAHIIVIDDIAVRP